MNYEDLTRRWLVDAHPDKIKPYPHMGTVEQGRHIMLNDVAKLVLEVVENEDGGYSPFLTMLRKLEKQQ